MDVGTAGSDRGEAAAAALLGAWGAYGDRFLDVTRRARLRFERRDWKGAQDDATRRLDLYGDAIGEALAAVTALGGDAVASRPFWTAVRSAYAARTEGRSDQELARTFFNSVVRRVFHTVGVDPSVEFVAPREAEPLPLPPFTVTSRIDAFGSWDALARRLTDRLRFACGWEDADRDALAIADELRQQARGRMPEALEIVRSIFYRSKGAYVVGRLDTNRGSFPFLLALANPRGRIVADAVLLDENAISIVFSFARSYFLVEYDRPRELVAFLLSLMPRKPLAEMYNAIGANRHGKTELYRSLLHHLDTTEDRFVIAPGQRGMVMCVFVLDGFDVVFKVIRDRFDPPKTGDRAEVMSKYRLVFRRDRAGRLVDAQEFEHLEFDRARFDPALLDELLGRCGETVE
ncbi:MAG TPA: isocitrate dehydrogenase kinase/phosphatase AceK regulatory subunit, partial [Candidatus Polarisedimenticolaceae bacterium]